MGKNYLLILRHKLNKIKSSVRVLYFKNLGLKIKDGQLGKIICEWPNKIKIGSDCLIEDYVIFKTRKPFSDDNYVIIGDRVFIGVNCEFNCNTSITIGNDCLIASNTTIVDTSHSYDQIDVKINQQQNLSSRIIVEDDVWIGTHCKILKGVTIGKGSIIGAGSLVNKSIPSYQIWAGTPARFIKNR